APSSIRSRSIRASRPRCTWAPRAGSSVPRTVEPVGPEPRRVLGVDDVVAQIVVSPSSPDTLYAARLGHAGVYRSNDRAASWKPASKGLKGSIQSAQSVAVDPTTPEV